MQGDWLSPYSGFPCFGSLGEGDSRVYILLVLTIIFFCTPSFLHLNFYIVTPLLFDGIQFQITSLCVDSDVDFMSSYYLSEFGFE